MCIADLSGSIFFTSFCKYVKWGSGKSEFFTTCQRIIREFCSHIGCESYPYSDNSNLLALIFF